MDDMHNLWGQACLELSSSLPCTVLTQDIAVSLTVHWTKDLDGPLCY